jgi:hypothetical protein
MFDALQHYYVCHIVTLLCSSHWNFTMFINLRRQGYVCHIATIWVCLSHYDDGAMFGTFRGQSFV